MVDRLVTINVLPDDALLLIFSFLRRISTPSHPPPSVDWKWHELAHVCRRWRHVIFASPRHLKLRLVITRERRRTTTFDCWPPLPISIWSNSHSADDLSLEGVTALKHSDRIHEIVLDVSTSMLEKSTAWVENSFPALEVLHLRSPYAPTVLPVGFLMSGSDGAPRRLREIGLSNVSFPHCLLRSNRGIVSLDIGLNPFGDAESLSAGALAAILSETYQLERLSVNPYPATPSNPDQRSTHPSLPANARAVLRALARFEFDGSRDYLEDLISRIDALILEQLVVFYPQYIFDVPQLSQFVSRTKHLSSLPHQMSLGFSEEAFTIKHHFRHLELPPPRRTFSLTLSIRHGWAAYDWMASELLHICGQMSPFTSSVEKLSINIQQRSSSDTDTNQWPQLLGAFRSVRDLHLWCSLWGWGPALCMESAMEESTRKRSEEMMFPALHMLRMNEIRYRMIDMHGIAGFINASWHSRRPFAVWEGPGSNHGLED